MVGTDCKWWAKVVKVAWDWQNMMVKAMVTNWWNRIVLMLTVDWCAFKYWNIYSHNFISTMDYLELFGTFRFIAIKYGWSIVDLRAHNVKAKTWVNEKDKYGMQISSCFSELCRRFNWEPWGICGRVRNLRLPRNCQSEDRDVVEQCAETNHLQRNQRQMMTHQGRNSCWHTAEFSLPLRLGNAIAINSPGITFAASGKPPRFTKG